MKCSKLISRLIKQCLVFRKITSSKKWLKSLSFTIYQQFDRQVLNIESPVFDNKRMEAEFQLYTCSMGDIATVMQQKKLAISRGHTHIGLSSASTTRQMADDKRFGDISCKY